MSLSLSAIGALFWFVQVSQSKLLFNFSKFFVDP